MRTNHFKRIGAAVMMAVMLAGCGDSFAGTYQFENSAETLTIKSDGTCVDDINGLRQACTWKKEGKGEYTITINTLLGQLVFDAEKVDAKTYTVSGLGVRTTMKKK